LFGTRLSFATAGDAAKRYLSGQTIKINGSKFPDANLRGVDNGSAKGLFGPGTVSGFAGFRSTKTGDLGWIDVEVFDRSADGYPDQLEIISWAYNNVGGASIEAGQTSSTPEPNTAALGLLAAGAAGLLALRRRRAQ
jgi:LPXTG-motif cell wall-anchored protein